MPRVIMHVDLDAFYASVEQLRKPALRCMPVIVGGSGEPGERGVVAAASYEARAFGVRSAMPLGRARRLCPQALFVPCDFTAYRAASEQVFAILRCYSPLIEPIALDEAYLDLTGSEQLLGEPRQVAVRLRDEVLERCGLQISVGVATCKLVAKVASDLRKPRSLVVVAPGQEAEVLKPLPIGRLPGCGPATIDRLMRLGLSTIGELAALPEPLLTEMFGRFGQQLHQHASGIDPSPVTPPGEPKSISREVTFDRDLDDPARVRETALSLLEDVGQSLRARGLAARTITLKVRYRPFDTEERQLTLASPSDRDEDLRPALARLVETHLRPARPVRLVGAGVSNLEPRATQLSLLEGRTEGRSQLDVRLDGIRQRFGEHAIFRGAAWHGPQRDVRRDDLDRLQDGA